MFKWNAAWTESHCGFKPIIRVENEKLGFFPFIVTDYEKFTKYLLFFFFYWVALEIFQLYINEENNRVQVYD